MSFDIQKVSIYDQVAFPSLPFPLSHPDHLASVARLVGRKAPIPSPCRVLELGCGAGGNLIPLADTLPNGQLVGVDVSDQQIEMALGVVKDVGLANIEFRAQNLLDFDTSCDPFDFIICHGVYSWTTEEVRDKILAICQAALTEHGVAYINFNTHPGWHLMGTLRDLIQYHTSKFEDPEARTKRARMLIDALVAAFPGDSTPYGVAVRQQLEQIQKYSDPFLFHAFLNVVNSPCYFHEFIDRAESHSLQHVADADTALEWGRRFNPKAEVALNEFVTCSRERNQLLDLAYETSSRRSIVRRRQTTADVAEAPRLSDELYAASRMRIVSRGGAGNGTTFQSPDGRSVTTADPATVAILSALANAWPESLSYGELAALIPEATPPHETAGAGRPAAWENHLFQCVLAGIAQLGVQPAWCTRNVSGKPSATRLARYQAAQGELVTNLRHVATRLPEFDRRVLQQLDGTQSVVQIEAGLSPLITGGDLKRPAGSAGAPDLGQDVMRCLSRLVENALLLPPA